MTIPLHVRVIHTFQWRGFTVARFSMWTDGGLAFAKIGADGQFAHFTQSEVDEFIALGPVSFVEWKEAA